MRGSGREPPVTMATARLHPRRGKHTVGGRVISELIWPRTGRGEIWGALEADGGTAVQRRALCLLAVSWAIQGGRVQAEPWWGSLLLWALVGFVHPLPTGSGAPRAV